MTSGWFRMYGDMLNDPKIQTLDPVHFKCWVNALCYAQQRNEGGNLGTLDDATFAFRMKREDVSSAFHALVERGRIVTDGETFRIRNWSKRQYKSDNSTERVKRHRERKRNAPETPRARAESEPDSDRKDSSIEESQRKKTGSRLPQGWEPTLKDIAFAQKEGFTDDEIAGIAADFTDYWIAQPGQKGRKVEWSATWRRWIRNQRRPNRGNGSGYSHARKTSNMLEGLRRSALKNQAADSDRQEPDRPGATVHPIREAGAA